MGKFRRITMAVAVLAVSAPAAIAADIIEYQPPEVVPQSYGGWYLRGDIGMTNQKLHGGLDNVLFGTVDNLEFLDHGTFSSAPSFRAGIGYKFNDWLRADITAELRGKADFSALDRYEGVDDGDATTWDASNEYYARKKDMLFMANGYVDLGTWSGLTPYVGAGIGTVHSKIYGFRDINGPNNGVAFAPTGDKWNMAWALHTGVGFEVTDRMTIDLGYSYVHLGDAQSGDISTFDGVNNVNNPMIFEDVISHDFKFGLRYRLN